MKKLLLPLLLLFANCSKRAVNARKNAKTVLLVKNVTVNNCRYDLFNIMHYDIVLFYSKKD